MRWLVFVTSFLFASIGGASAQTTTVVQSIEHADGSTQATAITIGGVAKWYLNAADCASPTLATIRVSTASVTATWGSAPQVWIGTECQLAESRTGTNPSCVQAQTTGNILVESNAFTFPLTRMLPVASATSSQFDLCNTSSQGDKRVYVMPETLGTDPQLFVTFTLTSDLTPPAAVVVETTTAQGDNSISLEWDSTEAQTQGSEAYYFALPGGCGTTTTDAGTGDAGTDDGGTGDAGVTDGGLATGFAPGSLPPVGDATYRSGAAGAGTGTSISTGSLGLADIGSSAAVGISIRDAAGNYGPLSNFACVTRIATIGLCGAVGDCPRGGCSVVDGAEDAGIATGLAALAVLGAFVLVRRSRR